MAYRMKNSPINKGTAAKGSPMKDFGATAIIAGITTAISTAASLASAAARKNQARRDKASARGEASSKNVNVETIAKGDSDISAGGSTVDQSTMADAGSGVGSVHQEQQEQQQQQEELGTD